MKYFKNDKSFINLIHGCLFCLRSIACKQQQRMGSARDHSHPWSQNMNNLNKVIFFIFWTIWRIKRFQKVLIAKKIRISTIWKNKKQGFQKCQAFYDFDEIKTLKHFSYFNFFRISRIFQISSILQSLRVTRISITLLISRLHLYFQLLPDFKNCKMNWFFY